jgi:hypothetical protein
VTANSERTMMIAAIIERHLIDYPRAADTTEGIRSWWVGRHRSGVSLADVEHALDWLVGRGRMSRTVLADGTIVFGRAVPPTTNGTP